MKKGRHNTDLYSAQLTINELKTLLRINHTKSIIDYLLFTCATQRRRCEIIFGSLSRKIIHFIFVV